MVEERYSVDGYGSVSSLMNGSTIENIHEKLVKRNSNLTYRHRDHLLWRGPVFHEECHVKYHSIVEKEGGQGFI